MRLFTPDNLHYPIKITKLLRKAGDDIRKNDTLFSYEYTSTVRESDADRPEGYDVERTFPARFESELEGSLETLAVTVGQILSRRAYVADIEEPCKHEVQYGGICAICGKDVTELATYNTTIRDTDRATINTVHGHTALLISQNEASRADEEAKRRLLDARKLSLVVDLDQTIIHATVDPTVAEWQQDPSNPNHDAVKDVRAFQLVDDGPGARGCWYYIKLRPGLAQFLKEISKYYELHIYTMGTRTYAENIAKIVDPERKIFGERILSRDESGSLTAKNLKRLFPVDTKMAVIIDDRGDVWQWSPNLIKVSAYDFFVGIGDINSSFLPKRTELTAQPIRLKAANGSSNGSIEPAVGDDSEVSAVDRLVTMAGKQDADSMKEKSDEQDEAIAVQLADRPLLQKQKILDAADEEAKSSPAVDATADLLADEDTSDFDHPRYRQNLLQDEDDELTHLSTSLQLIHKRFFEQYGHSLPNRHQDLQAVPDVAHIMSGLKAQVLAGTNIVFSGVVPLGVDLRAHDTVIWAQSFGAQVSDSITKRTTHVVASPERRTAKVRQAARKRGKIKIVSVAWLMACFTEWRKVDETAYKIHSDADTKITQDGGLPDSFGDSYAQLSSSESGDAITEDETEDTGNEAGDDTEDELAKYAPKIERKDSIPTTDDPAEDWGEIDDEVNAFLDGDEDSESDLDSANSEEPRKRRRTASEEPSEVAESRLQKRKKEALSRTSSLVQVIEATPVMETELEEDQDDEDDLEAALAAELESNDV